MIRKSFYILVLIILTVINTNAQKKAFDQMFTVGWDVNIPIDNSFVSKTSLEGFKLEYRKMVKSNLSLGTEVNWARYSQYLPKKTYQITDGAITTDLYPYIYEFGMAVNAHYYFGDSKMFLPYLGLALGANYSQQRLYYNSYYSESDNWGFLVRPELGVIIRPDPHAGFGIMAGARYSYATNTEKGFGINGLKSLSLQLGIVFIQ